VVDHGDSTNGGAKTDPKRCPDCDETRKIINDTWTLLEEMKEGYEKAIELSGQNYLELQQDFQKLQRENHQLREEVNRLKGAN
jgi:hypothetical protein